MRLYIVAFPVASYFFLSHSAQIRWPWVSEAAVAIDVAVGAFGVLAFIGWWPIRLIFGESPFADRLCRVGLKSIIWAFYMIPLSLLFGGLKHLLDSPISF
jgi:hypothetical protein